MSIRQLHPDWPPFDTAAKSYNLPEPVSDLQYALSEYPTWGTATAPSEKTEGFQIAEVERVVRYHVSYHSEVWTPTNDAGGTELSLYVVGQLIDGRWFSVVAWNDYTGWGCQDGSDVRIGDTEEQVVAFGLDQEGRRLLGYEETTR